MKRSFWVKGTLIIFINIALVYFGGGYYVYYCLTKVDPPAVNILANNPSNFKVMYS